MKDAPKTSPDERTRIWDALCRPPASALRQIKGGRLSGKTDINPQWRMRAMTEQFGPVGVGWRYSVDRLWLEPAQDGQVAAFAGITLWYRTETGEWSEPIPGFGGSMFVEAEKSGLYVSDEAYKMAITDALSVAMKALGVAADVYAGVWDGTKYRDTPATAPQRPQNASEPAPAEGHSSIVNTATREGSGVNAGAPGVRDKEPCRMIGEMYTPAVRSMVKVRGEPVETADFVFLAAEGGSKRSAKVWGADAIEAALAVPAGAQIEIAGSWSVWRDRVSINVREITVVGEPPVAGPDEGDGYSDDEIPL